MLPRANLYFKDPKVNSDKVYQLHIEEVKDGLYDVYFEYGRRCGNLMSGIKNSSPLTRDHAEKIYSDVYKEKMAKGYTESPSGIPYTYNTKQNQQSGIYPMLPAPITEKELEILLDDDNWAIEQKIDGYHIIVIKTKEGIEACNKKGLYTTISDHVIHALEKFPGTVTLDGEMVKNKHYVFDILELNGENLTQKPYSERIEIRDSLPIYKDSLTSLPVYTGKDKRALFNKIRDSGGEGVVFKRLDSFYIPGKTEIKKYKFRATCTAKVYSVNKTRSVSISMENKSIGNVAIPANKEIPQIDDLVEIRYRTYTGHALIEPFYLGKRDDTEEDKLNSLRTTDVL